jgi:hypothetical protein
VSKRSSMEKKSMSSQEDEEGPGVRSQEDEDRYDRTGPLGSRLGPTNRLGAFNLSRGPLESINLEGRDEKQGRVGFQRAFTFANGRK